MASRDPPDPMQLAAEVLHELRQPLLGIKAYAQLMGEESPGKSQVAQVLAQVDRMEQIISDFTRIASNRPPPMEKLDLSLPLREGERLFRLNPESARVQLELELGQGLELLGNGRLLQQLTLNLLNNARDAMSGLGRLKVVASREGASLALYFADWGPGIASEMRERIFEPYVTNRARGSGLGLAVCRRIAEEHGGTIGLVSSHTMPDSPPPATVFRVLLPASHHQTSVRKKRILIVDDEAIIRAVFRDLMGREAEVVEAETAEEALAMLRTTTFDLIVTDKNLPGLSGLDLAQQARRLDPSSKVILMTGYPSVVTAQQATELGVIDYLLKPFDEIREVRDKLRAVLNAPPAQPLTAPSPTHRRVDVYEDNPSSAKAVTEALALLGLEARIVQDTQPPPGDPPIAVVVSWDFSAAQGSKAVELGRNVRRGAPFVVLAEHLTMEAALECLRGGAAACLPKLLSDVRALSRELARALKLSGPS